MNIYYEQPKEKRAIRALEAVLPGLGRRMSRNSKVRLARLAAKANQALLQERASMGTGATPAGFSYPDGAPGCRISDRHTEGGPSVQLLLLSPSMAMFDFGHTLVSLSSWPDRFPYTTFRALEYAFEEALRQGEQLIASGQASQTASPRKRTKSTSPARSQGAKSSDRCKSSFRKPTKTKPASTTK